MRHFCFFIFCVLSFVLFSCGYVLAAGTSVDPDPGQSTESGICQSSDLGSGGKKENCPNGHWNLTERTLNPCLGINPEQSWIWTDVQISGDTKTEIAFVHGGTYIPPTDPCGSCINMGGWSCSWKVTADEYFGGIPSGTVTYSIITPSIKYESQWVCQ